MFVKNILLGAFLATTAIAAPAPVEESSLAERGLEKRWKSGKCEVHIYVDASNGWAIDAHRTHKWHVNIKDAAGEPIGYDWAWQNIGEWGATNPHKDGGKIRINTVTGFELWIDGDPPARKSEGQKHKNNLVLHYDTQHWESRNCKEYICKAAGPSNGYRNQYDWFCEFHC